MCRRRTRSICQGDYELSVPLGADAASGQRLHARRSARQGRRLAQGDRAARFPHCSSAARNWTSPSSPASGRSPTSKGRIPTTMEWARKLTDDDIKVLCGEAPY